MAPPVIRFDGVSKRYLIHRRDGAHSDLGANLLTTLTRPFRRRTAANANVEEVWALKDISFQVEAGEVFGLVGRNGAGKSTALKLLSRITEPTTGRIGIRGRVTSLLEVGTGFHGELSGRENIYLNGAILGMSTGAIRRRFDAIVAFSGIERFLDTPVKRYSSGMYVRLAFAIAAQLEHEVLVVDEVLAVGDVAFRDQCLAHIEHSVRERGLTVLLVSHELSQIRRLAKRCVLLDGGRLVSVGPTDEVVAEYLAQLAAVRPVRPAGQVVRSVQVLGAGGTASDTLITGTDMVVEFDLACPTAGAIEVSIETPWGLRLATLGAPVAAGRRTWRCTLGALPLAPGNYRLAVTVRDAVGVELERHPDASLFMVLADEGDPTPIGEGLVALRGRWSESPGPSVAGGADDKPA